MNSKKTNQNECIKYVLMSKRPQLNFRELEHSPPHVWGTPTSCAHTAITTVIR